MAHIDTTPAAAIWGTLSVNAAGQTIILEDGHWSLLEMQPELCTR